MSCDLFNDGSSHSFRCFINSPSVCDSPRAVKGRLQTTARDLFPRIADGITHLTFFGLFFCLALGLLALALGLLALAALFLGLLHALFAILELLGE